jgi:hypothetical protein
MADRMATILGYLRLQFGTSTMMTAFIAVNRGRHEFLWQKASIFILVLWHSTKTIQEENRAKLRFQTRMPARLCPWEQVLASLKSRPRMACLVNTSNEGLFQQRISVRIPF